MALKIRLARHGAKKRPFYHVVVAENTSPRDGKFIEKIGRYNPMLPKDNDERVVIDLDRVKYWLSVGAQPTGRLELFLADKGVLEKPKLREQTKQHLPKAKAQERLEAQKEKEAEAKAQAEEEAAAAAEAPAEEAAAPVEAEEPKVEAAEEPKAEATEETPSEADQSEEEKKD